VHETSRQVVHRRRARPVLDKAIDTALADIPPEMRPAVIQLADSIRAQQGIRSQLSDLGSRFGIRWFTINAAAQRLL
jgi:hypothetical protein